MSQSDSWQDIANEQFQTQVCRIGELFDPTAQGALWDKPVEFGSPVKQVLWIGSNGCYLEMKSAWSHLFTPVGQGWGNFSPLAGQVPTQSYFFPLGKPVPIELFREIDQQFSNAAPLECAAFIVWNSKAADWELLWPTITSQSASKVGYSLEGLGPEHTVVFDIHSHAALGAFFSSTDIRDDAGSFKVSIVLGGYGAEQGAGQREGEECGKTLFPADCGPPPLHRSCAIALCQGHIRLPANPDIIPIAYF